MLHKDKKLLRSHTVSHVSEKEDGLGRHIKEAEWAEEPGSHPAELTAAY